MWHQCNVTSVNCDVSLIVLLLAKYLHHGFFPHIYSFLFTNTTEIPLLCGNVFGWGGTVTKGKHPCLKHYIVTVGLKKETDVKILSASVFFPRNTPKFAILKVLSRW